jgi:uncharacterized circularly permuted ATP-grasp superfamily protein
VATTSSRLLAFDYDVNGDCFDEVLDSDHQVRPPYQTIVERFSEFSRDKLSQRERRLDITLRDRGVTFESETDPDQAVEQTLTVDPVPRVIDSSVWEDHLKPGLHQRVRALNEFLNDIYGDADILSDEIIPAELVLENDSFHRRLHGIKPPGGIYTHIAGIDLIRDGNGTYRVLEDNLQIPSGVSYMLENRRILTETFPRLINQSNLRSVDHYPDLLLNCLNSLAPDSTESPAGVLLTPGPYNSAYFEHVFLARKMGIELVKGEDLFVEDDTVWMQLPGGARRVDVIYRRINTEFLDPAAFRSDSLLGVPGLIDAYQSGNVVIANAPGAGVADDKAIYSYVPRMIEYYLNESPIIPNVETYLGRNKEHREYILDNVERLTIKRVDGAGGYGMLIGPSATGEEIDSYLDDFRDEPQKYIAQPTIQLSTHPCFIEDEGDFEPRHIDLRPFVLFGADGPATVPGGLTRVAMKRNSLVVNSSQGGGSKDTWVLG